MYETSALVVSKQALRKTNTNNTALNILIGDESGRIQGSLFGQIAENKNGLLFPGLFCRVRFDEKSIQVHKAPKFNSGSTKYMLQGIKIIEMISKTDKDAKSIGKIHFNHIPINLIQQSKLKQIDIFGVITNITPTAFGKSNGLKVQISDMTASVNYCEFKTNKFPKKIREIMVIINAEKRDSIKFGC
eukprot:282252_1